MPNLKLTVGSRKGRNNLVQVSKEKRKREKGERSFLQMAVVVVVSQTGWSQVEREMAPES